MAKNTGITRIVQVKKSRGVVRTVKLQMDSGISATRSLWLLEARLDREYGKGKWEFVKEMQ